MTHRLRGAFLDLSLNLRGGRGVVDENAELVVMNEEAAGQSLTIGVERHGLDGQITDVSADHHAHETEQTTRNG